MIRHSPSERLLAISLASLAGYVDALAFLELGGYFVSFMTGNTTRLGTALASSPWLAILPAALVALFVLGVVAASFVRKLSWPGRAAGVMILVALLLALAGLFHEAGWSLSAVLMMAVAMGAENAVFERDGEVSIGVTYMTGTLVKLGQRIAAALSGGDRTAWIWYLMLWLGLAAGATLGSISYLRFGLSSSWIAACLAAFLGWLVFRVERISNRAPNRKLANSGPDR